MNKTHHFRVNILSMSVLVVAAAGIAVGLSLFVQSVVNGIDSYINQPDFRMFTSSDGQLTFEYPNGYVVTSRKDYGDGMISTTMSLPRTLRNSTLNPKATQPDPMIFLSETSIRSYSKKPAEYFAEKEDLQDRLHKNTDHTLTTKEKRDVSVGKYQAIQLRYTSTLKDERRYIGEMLSRRETIVMIATNTAQYELTIYSQVESREDEVVKRIIDSLRIKDE
ncbi:MAG: hypothetical protein WBC12_04170 [Candidatus Saccharimonas aalborgensis]